MFSAIVPFLLYAGARGNFAQAGWQRGWAWDLQAGIPLFGASRHCDLDMPKLTDRHENIRACRAQFKAPFELTKGGRPKAQLAEGIATFCKVSGHRYSLDGLALSQIGRLSGAIGAASG